MTVEWISVDERLPEFDKPVLVSNNWVYPYSSRGISQSVAWLNEEGSWERFTKNGETVSWTGEVSFWMNIPPTPDTPKEKI
jgi:hypothetical protein